MKQKLMGCLILVLLVTTACADGAGNGKSEKTSGEMGGKVLQSMRASQYVVMEIQGEGDSFWAATRFQDVKAGDQVELLSPMMMRDFTVKSLDRTFPEIYFAQGIMVNGEQPAAMEAMSQSQQGSEMSNPHAGMENPHEGMDMSRSQGSTMDGSDVKSLADGVTLGALLENPAGFKGSRVRVRAKVVKYLAGIMNKNWLHLKDSTTGAGDVVATTDEEFKPGETVILEATVTTDKDFGFGYRYDVLLEQANRINP